MIPRNEYPRPQLMRADWLNLNGEWDFEIDHSMSGKEKNFQKRSSLDGKITVPFCPESKLSGLAHTDFMNCVWYRKDIHIPSEWEGKDVILHFGAVDYHAFVYVNGEFVCEHKGGYTPFSANITPYLKDSGNYITLCAEDQLRTENQPAGKQSLKYASHGCHYTRTTGIWQTVWMEAVEKAYIQNVRYTANISDSSVCVQIHTSPCAMGGSICVKTFFEGKETGSASCNITSEETVLSVSLSELHLWDVGQGNLYDTEITLTKDGKEDAIRGYFGMREVSLANKMFNLNGRVVFGRWVLDQGFYPDGIYTAPSDEALKQDILYSMELGFNGARLHEKIFEPRFLYWADKLGYLVWGEHANWGLDVTEPGQVMHFLPEWLESVERDYSHPSIIGWCPFNETWDNHNRKQCDDVISLVYYATKAVDKTRPVLDTSGGFHVVTDIFDVHDYEQNVEKFISYYENAINGEYMDGLERNPRRAGRHKWNGEPFFMSEYGGIQKSMNGDGWGYGIAPKNDEEFIERYRGLTTSLLENEAFLGFCYTQLYDVEQEVNGLMTYDRVYKFDPKIFYDINTQIAAVEKKYNK